MTTLPISRRPAKTIRGFALVVTLSLMILLTILAVGLLSLSTIELRGASSREAGAEARANARLALMIAIGELQKQVGPDQRITAPGDITGENAIHPQWTGVWDSWKAGASPPSGGDDPSDHATIPASLNPGMHPSYTESRSDHFRSWLVSMPNAASSSDVLSAKNLALTGTVTPSSTDLGVKLVAGGSLGGTTNAKEHVFAALNDIKNNANSVKTGRMAWWVADESTKARLMEDKTPTNGTSVALQTLHHGAPGNTGHQVLAGLENATDSTLFSKAITRNTLDLIDGIATPEAHRQYFHSTTPYSRGLLSDVREGGMKRDLSGLLSRPINIGDNSDDFMLYRFGNNADRVPIQDLSAYYQLYKNQVKYTSTEAGPGIQIQNPDFGTGPPFLREYTNLYRLPVPIKIQFVLSMIAEPWNRTQAQIDASINKDTHKLNVGISPSFTMWNPYNVPLTMRLGRQFATQFMLFSPPVAIRWNKNDGQFQTGANVENSLAWLTGGKSGRRTVFRLFLSGDRPVVFEPGQVRVFSLANKSLTQIDSGANFQASHEVQAGWNPDNFIRLRRSERTNSAQHTDPLIDPQNNDGALTFSASDRISLTVEPSGVRNELDNTNESALHFFNRQRSADSNRAYWARHFQFTSRHRGETTNFNRDLMQLGLPDGTQNYDYEAKTGSDIISAETTPFLVFSLSAGAETSQENSSGNTAGRRFASRPFLHSSSVTGTVFVDRIDPEAHYQHGWNWQVDSINSPFEATVSVDRKDNGSYGGGNTTEFGTSHVVQQEVPVAPPISIASLSHAQLGGFSLANTDLTGNKPQEDWFEDVTASGQGGLFPHTVQAIGNSYAHPSLAKNRAFGTWTRNYSELKPATEIPFVDHSYLANKSLWDEYYFSSITDTTTQAFGGSLSGTARENAERFFFGDGTLLNSRFEPYLDHFTEADLASYFDGKETNLEGIDRLSSQMLVKGPFNINSTSEEAWKALFSSLRGKNIAYLDAENSLGKTSLEQEVIDGTPVAGFSLPNGKPTEGSSSDPKDPEQWTGWREITDAEIDELATAMVKQVRLRGPFLSLSEFVNRRLDASNTALSLKGALQAALDDPDVSINSGFRSADRQFSNAEISGISAAFPEALEGPVAYGSSAYVDQADILRGLAGQLTPRGDTFVIRTYGDSLDKAGNVRARAYCEAVVQRVPDYVDPADENFVKTSDLKAPPNQQYGRQIRIVSFRYLNLNEI